MNETIGAMTGTEAKASGPAIIGHFSHSFVELDDPERWTFFVSHHDHPVRRLVVFVHGFRGESVGTWLDFPLIDADLPENLWWAESDLLFIGYNSTKENIAGVANRIRRNLPRFYPIPFAEVMKICDCPARSDISTPYEELYLVGHSLGGVILRRVLCDVAQEWLDSGGSSDKPALLDANARLFSPASAGFEPSGWLGLLRATGFWDRMIEIILRRSPAYTDLQPNSLVLRETRDRTVSLINTHGADLSALRAHIVWANPDGVVITERYGTDYVDSSSDNKGHISICKPRDDEYELPWAFVQTGRFE